MTRRMLCIAAGLLAALLPLGAAADARLAGIFGDHMVVQRDAPLRVWGRAAPGESLQVEFRGQQRATMAGRDGRWSVELPATGAGGPFDLTLRAANMLVVRDILVGDVWVCSGQSNMEWALQDSRDAAAEVAASDHPRIRHVKIAHRASLEPLDDIDPVAWEVSHPYHAGRFSAVAYFFARKLVRERGVPIGLVNASWGGSHIETWTSTRAALEDPDLAPIVRAMPADNATLAAQRSARMQDVVQRWQPGLALAEGSAGGNAGSSAGGAAGGWAAPTADDRDWRVLAVPRIWELQGLPGIDGVVWYRRTVELGESQAAAGATLHLGAIDDCDETYVNGQRIGGLCGWDTPRRHAVPPGLLKPGANVIAVRVTDTGGGGGFHGDAAQVRLETAAGALPLAGAWKARVESILTRVEPGHNELPTLLFNGMIQPLLPMRMRGIIWYQGESNVARAARYVGAFQRLIVDWRRQWAQGDFPFYYVQLASFLPLRDNTLEGSSWAELRDAQRQALVLPNTGMAVATDIGDADDIHPKNKQDVGERLALLALHGDGARGLVHSGPRYEAMRIQRGRIELRFTQVGGGLAVRGGGRELQGFALADASGKFQPARAVIERQRVLVWRDDMPAPVAVRYGWVDNPQQADLINREGLPASPFRTDEGPLVTAGGRFTP